jgi:hypothetical protein
MIPTASIDPGEAAATNIAARQQQEHSDVVTVATQYISSPETVFIWFRP